MVIMDKHRRIFFQDWSGPLAYNYIHNPNPLTKRQEHGCEKEVTYATMDIHALEKTGSIVPLHRGLWRMKHCHKQRRTHRTTKTCPHCGHTNETDGETAAHVNTYEHTKHY
jgi:hypothetical protein